MSALFTNRELSWLDFNERVLTLAEDDGIPLLERVKFVSIASSNLDEFFQVRVAALHDLIEAGITVRGADGMSPDEVVAEIRRRVFAHVDRRDSITHRLLDELTDRGISIVEFDELNVQEHADLREYFLRQVFPVLTPLAVDPTHPFPYISNLSLSVGVFVRDALTNDRRFARVKIPDSLNRLIELRTGRYVTLDDVIVAHLHELFPGMTVESWGFFRVTRNTDLVLEEEEAEDLLEAVEVELRRRRFGNASRLEVDRRLDDQMLDILLAELELDPIDVYRQSTNLDLRWMSELHRIARPELHDDPWVSVTAGRLALADAEDESFFSVIRNRDLMVHHPYESFSSSTEDFVRQAADDPRVVGIKATLYRTSANSAIAQSLIAAAERGVQVVALIELKARFDEQTNVKWAKELERAGVHVMYGLVGLKTHAKCILVVRQEKDGLRRYVHIGTGNYNSNTARVYEDMGIFTCDERVTDDVARLFNHLTGFSRENDYQVLLVAPRALRDQMKALIVNEMRYGADGCIDVKFNALADPEMVSLLAEAAQAGVRVNVLVRGICCLNRGAMPLPGLRVRSILGRYLEHSRLYRFAHGDNGNPAYFIGSADLMPRNLDKRVEVLIPVRHPKHQRWIDQVLGFYWRDDVSAFEMNDLGQWVRVGPESLADGDAQRMIMSWASEIQLRKNQPSDFDLEIVNNDESGRFARPGVMSWIRNQFGLADE